MVPFSFSHTQIIYLSFAAEIVSTYSFVLTISFSKSDFLLPYLLYVLVK